MTRRLLLLPLCSALALAQLSLTACAGTDRALPLADFVPLPQAPVGGPAASTEAEPLPADSPDETMLMAQTGTGFSPAEIAYVTATAGAVFRRRASERATRFVTPETGGGYGVCLRSAKKGGGYDLAMIVLQRRLDGSAISQVDDDTLVYRRAADTRPCAARSLAFVAARRG
ncbi:hypothetical protein [Aurantimonas sp. Leaf443]|uniref:hypothetical protein n=1 Tax=Aurantimonas sp. Leaf443 TaxID=1736378 RepID=UPI0006F8CFCB|nr:hypothetical protein [Aurantimonas sp. Leaf443]KQT86257.1 hypothetical protein ASG48_06735 [Aurantimonas sp. Leaf443]